MRQVKVDHVRYERKVQPAPKRRSSHQHLAVAFGKQPQILPSLVGNELAMDARGCYAPAQSVIYAYIYYVKYGAMQLT